MELGLDPLTTNLVVDDKSCTEKTICLAVSPSLKTYVIPGRARLTDIKLDEYEIAALDTQLQMFRENLSTSPAVSATYFRPDEKKSGGAYLTKNGAVKKLDDFEKNLIFEGRLCLSWKS